MIRNNWQWFFLLISIACLSRIERIILIRKTTNWNNRKKFFTIPYINNITESFMPVCRSFGFNMSHSILNTLKRYIKCGKDVLEVLSHQDVVYKIICHDCDAT